MAKTIALLPLTLAATKLACSSNSGPSANIAATSVQATETKSAETVAAPLSGTAVAPPATATAAAALVTPAASQSDVAVSMSQPPGDPQGWHFAPATVAVGVGGTVTWTNPAGNEIHTVTADSGAFDSG